MKLDVGLGRCAYFEFQIRCAIVIVISLFAVTVVSAQSVDRSKQFVGAEKYCSLIVSGTKSGIIVTEALLFVPSAGQPGTNGGSQMFIYSVACNRPDYFSVVEFAGKAPRPSRRSRILRIRFRAKLEVEPLGRFGELATFRARAKVSRLYSVEPAAPTSVPPDFNAPRPIMKFGELVKEMSTRLVFDVRGQDAMMIGEINVPVLGFEIVDGSARKELPPGSRRVTWHSFSNIESRWIVSGTLEIVNEPDSFQYDFVIIWSVSSESWVVDSIVFKSKDRK